MPYAEGDKRVANITSQLIGRNHKTSKDAFNEEVDFLGANINFNSNEHASGLSKYSERILQLMADGALIPSLLKKNLIK
jgi:hypothetical protein